MGLIACGELRTAQLLQVADGGGHVVQHSGEVHVRNALAEAEFPHHGSDGGVVTVLYPGKQVVLDLVVESAVEEAQPAAAHIGGRDHLLVQEGVVLQSPCRHRLLGGAEQSHALEVVRDDEEEGQVVAADHEQRGDVQQRDQRWLLEQRQRDPPQEEQHDGGLLEEAVAGQQAGHLHEVEALEVVQEGVQDVREAEEGQQNKHVDVLQQVVLL
mmetsp:Transcript_2690/g.3686  ORF Transcript_2690/g.3686 Transcript_2690/m.3686 type:complete len:213 (+) Transcript_2690:152-790(+)